MSLVGTSSGSLGVNLLNPKAQDQSFEESELAKVTMRVYGIIMIGFELFTSFNELVSKLDTKVIYEKLIQRGSLVMLYIYCYMTNMGFFLIAISLCS
jgi:hypothetical protein